MIDGRDFGHMVSAQPPKGVENKINHTDGQLCQCDPRKPVDTEACVNFPGWQYSQCVVTFHCWEELTVPMTLLGEENWKLCVWNSPGLSTMYLSLD